MKYKLAMLALIVIAIVLVGCTKIYVCHDGTTQTTKSKCPIIPSPDVTEKAAIAAMDNYGSAYALAKGDKFTRVNTFAEGVDWYSNVIFTNQKSGSINELKFKIDGKTKSVSCIESCEYISGNQTNSIVQ